LTIERFFILCLGRWSGSLGAGLFGEDAVSFAFDVFECAGGCDEAEDGFVEFGGVDFVADAEPLRDGDFDAGPGEAVDEGEEFGVFFEDGQVVEVGADGDAEGDEADAGFFALHEKGLGFTAGEEADEFEGGLGVFAGFGDDGHVCAEFRCAAGGAGGGFGCGDGEAGGFVEFPDFGHSPWSLEFHGGGSRCEVFHDVAAHFVAGAGRAGFAYELEIEFERLEALWGVDGDAPFVAAFFDEFSACLV